MLHRAYESAEALLVLREMADALALELVSKALVTDQIVLTVGYDIDNLKQGSSYQGVVKIDCYGRRVPQHAHGSFNLGCFLHHLNCWCRRQRICTSALRTAIFWCGG